MLQRGLVTGPLKRTQKGSEGERYRLVRLALNGIELRNYGLLESAQGVCMLEGNTFAGVRTRADERDPESKAHSRYTSRLQGNQ